MCVMIRLGFAVLEYQLSSTIGVPEIVRSDHDACTRPCTVKVVMGRIRMRDGRIPMRPSKSSREGDFTFYEAPPPDVVKLGTGIGTAPGVRNWGRLHVKGLALRECPRLYCRL